MALVTIPPLIIVTGFPRSGKTTLLKIIESKRSYDVKVLATWYVHMTHDYKEALKAVSRSLQDKTDVRKIVEIGITSEKEILLLKEIKKMGKDKVVIVFIDRDDTYRSLAIVQSPGYAEHGYYIPDDYFANQRELYDNNRNLFELTLINNSTHESLYEQAEIFLSSKLNTHTDFWLSDELFNPKIQQIITLDIIRANNRIMKYYANNPLEIHRLSSWEFENFIGGILYDLGYEVELTKQTRDGGFDIKAVKKEGLGPLLYLVDCKKHSPEKPVGIEVVRQMHSVKNLLQASKGVLVTTSYFTKDAKDLQRNLGYQMELKEYNDILSWLQKYK